jgi:hypothetical protein
MTPLFTATQRFDPSDAQRWIGYMEWARIPQLVELVTLDGILCPPVAPDRIDEDWKHIVNEDFRLDYFLHLDYLLSRVKDVARRNVLGLYLNPDHHILTPPAPGGFVFAGYDLIEEMGEVSALNNCGGFPETFSNAELNQFGLLAEFHRANDVKRLLRENNPEEPHAFCELYAVWRLIEG